MCFVDARVVQDRLDDVLGPVGWQDDYEILPDGNVLCRLKIKLGDEWIIKVDVGGPSEQSDGGDRMKAAFSDALKRAAVKFGIGRLLYRMPTQWCDYDPQKRQFVKPPVLPDFALPAKDRQTQVARVAKPQRPEGLRGKGVAIMEQAKTIADLRALWQTMPEEMREACKQDGLKHLQTLWEAAWKAHRDNPQITDEEEQEYKADEESKDFLKNQFTSKKKEVENAQAQTA
jgi:hypothetical protein